MNTKVLFFVNAHSGLIAETQIKSSWIRLDRFSDLSPLLIGQ